MALVPRNGGTNPHIQLPSEWREEAAPAPVKMLRRHKGKAAGGLTVAGLVAAWSMFGPDIRVYAEDQTRKVAAQEAQKVQDKLDAHIKDESEMHKDVQTKLAQSAKDMGEVKGMLRVLCGKKCD